jgi:hypothetical protein
MQSRSLRQLLFSFRDGSATLQPCENARERKCFRACELEEPAWRFDGRLREQAQGGCVRSADDDMTPVAHAIFYRPPAQFRYGFAPPKPCVYLCAGDTRTPSHERDRLGNQNETRRIIIKQQVSPSTKTAAAKELRHSSAEPAGSPERIGRVGRPEFASQVRSPDEGEPTHLGRNRRLAPSSADGSRARVRGSAKIPRTTRESSRTAT